MPGKLRPSVTGRKDVAAFPIVAKPYMINYLFVAVVSEHCPSPEVGAPLVPVTSAVRGIPKVGGIHAEVGADEELGVGSGC